jgi:hypothetical protein
VSKDVCPNLPVDGVAVLGVEAPPNLPHPRTDVPSASIMSRPSSDDKMSETAANRTDVCVAINTQEPVDPLEPWNETTTETPILFPVDDAAYHTTTPAKKLSMMRLYRCVMDATCPRFFLDKFMHILRDEISSERLSLDSAPSRSAFVNYFTKKYPPAPPIPRDTPLETDVTNVSNTTPEDYRRRRGDVAQVVTLTLKSQLQDLLGDKQIWGDPENLLLNSEDNFAPYCNVSGAMDDVLDGSWYSSTVAALKIGKNSRQFLIPIIIYMDKTGTDANQRHCLEPVLFTLGVFSRKLRNQTRAWRLLGFVPDLQLTLLATKQSVRSKLLGKGIGERNFYTCLGAVLQSFIERQSLAKVENGGLKAWLRIGDHVKAFNLVAPLCFVIVDAKSGDMLCGRFGGYNTQRMSRACHVSLDQCDNPNHQCRWANLRYFKYLSKKATLMPAQALYNQNSAALTKEDRQSRIKLVKRLHSMSQHRHISAFQDVVFGSNKRGICAATPTDLKHGSNKRGICAATPTDLKHAFLEGLQRRSAITHKAGETATRYVAT